MPMALCKLFQNLEVNWVPLSETIQLGTLWNFTIFSRVRLGRQNGGAALVDGWRGDRRGRVVRVGARVRGQEQDVCNTPGVNPL